MKGTIFYQKAGNHAFLTELPDFDLHDTFKSSTFSSPAENPWLGTENCPEVRLAGPPVILSPSFSVPDQPTIDARGSELFILHS